jgi:FMN-dependent NADH-azoreductase
MKRLLYITANTKPEELSSSKTVGRRLVNGILAKYRDIELEEVDLYEQHIPQLKHVYFESRSAIVSSEARSKLSPEEHGEVDQIIALCDQFRAADIYVLAAPMWSLSFPAPVKEYIDCVVQAGKTIAFKDNKPYGLLDDRPRLFIYVQSSGGNIPWIIRPALNKGLNYVHDIVKFMGIERFEELLVDGTGTTEDERLAAIQNATERIDGVVDRA